MKVQFIKQSSFQTVGPQGPFTRVFAIGDTLELPEMHARLVIAQGDAKLAPEKPAKAEAPVKAAPKSKGSK